MTQPRKLSLYEEQQARQAAKRRQFQPAARDLAEWLRTADSGDTEALTEQWIIVCARVVAAQVGRGGVAGLLFGCCPVCHPSLYRVK